MKDIREQIKALYTLEGYEFKPVPGHPGGRNLILVCCRNGRTEYVLRVSELDAS